MRSLPNQVPGPLTLVDIFERRLEDQPERPVAIFLEDGDAESAVLAGRELLHGARAVAASIQESARPGDRALLLLPSGPDFVTAYAGCLFAGVIPVPAYPPPRQRTDARIDSILADASPSIVLATERTIANRPPAAGGARWIAPSSVPPGAAASWKRPAITPETLALLQYTSGSTGNPRGVRVSHAHLLANVRDMDHDLSHDASSVMVTWLPLFHDMGLIYGLLQPIVQGFPCVMMPPAAFLQSPVRWLRAITRYHGTHAAAPNFAYDLCVRRIGEEAREGLDLSSWQVAINGAEPVRPDTLDRFASSFAAQGFRRAAFCPGFGLAESTLKVTTTARDEEPRILRVDAAALGRHQVRPGEGRDARALVGCGAPVPETRLRIVDPRTARAVPADGVGEIWVGGRIVADGYWNKPDATAETFGARIEGEGGAFLRTGDLGFVHDGHLFITGRLKDVIVHQGMNYYPQDIERTVEAAHPALAPAGAAAIAVDDAADEAERLVVVAEVQRTERRRLDAGDVIAAVRQAVAAKNGIAPDAVVLIEPRTLPKTSSGKVRRGTCRDLYQRGSLSVVAAWTAAEPLPAETRTTPASRPVREWLIERFARLLKLPAAAVDPSAPLGDLGIDSVGAAELAADLEARLGRPIPATVVYDHPTIDAISAHYDTARETERAGGPRAAASPSGAIAIVGMGCRFPGAPSVDAFWTLLHEGRDAIRSTPPERWTSNVAKFGGFLDDVDRFDAEFFGIAPREAERMDPQQRLLLEVAWETLEDAAIPPDRLGGSRTGVFAGIANSDYARLLMRAGVVSDIYLGTGSALSIAANRLSYLLDLRGPSLAVDTACSSSLVAVAMACQSLRRGECDLALAGGVNVILSPEYTLAFSAAGMMAPDGRCKAFDAAADGYVRGEGAGLVALRRLEDAERDGHRILAVIRGVAVNQDGRTAGLTAPNGPAQRAVVRAALDDADLPAARVGYVEAHGTGTPLGDPIEINALATTVGMDRAPGDVCRVGSVKTNIGHLETAAGIAGLIKAVLALRHREIPASLHCQTLNPRLDLDGTALRVATTRERWESAGRRVAGVSSFGFGGTNAHVVLEEYVERPQAAQPDVPQVLALSARDREALTALAAGYTESLDARRDGWGEICSTAATGRATLRERLTVVAGSKAEARGILSGWLEGDELAPVRRGSVAPNADARVVFLFTGQGTQYPAMARDLYRDHAVFRETIDACSTALGRTLRTPLAELLYGAAPSTLTDMRIAQPAISAVQIALARLWISWGIEPAAVIGHSLGEYAAAHIAGVLTLGDTMRLVAARGRLLESIDEPGAMVVTTAPREAVEDALHGARRVSLAAVNGPSNVVYSGAAAEVARIAAKLTAAGYKCTQLPIAQASHSPLVEGILDEFAAHCAPVTANAPAIPLVSNVTGRWLHDAPDATYWRRHLREPVLFADGLRTLAGGSDGRSPQGTADFRLHLEIGPHPALVTLGEQSGGPGSLWVPSLHRDKPARRAMLDAAAALWTAGVPPRWRELFGPARRPVPLPSYPFQRTRFWIPAAAGAGAADVANGTLRRVAIAGTERRVYETRVDAMLLEARGAHRVDGAVVAPASFFLDLVLSASPTPQAPLQHVVFSRPLTLTHRPVTVQVVLEPSERQSWNFSVYSREGSGDETPFVSHCGGRIAPPRPVSLTRVSPGGGHALQPAEFYARLALRGIDVPDTARLLTEIEGRRDGATASLTATDADDHRMAALDAVLQTASVALLDEPAGVVFTQASIEQAEIFAPLAGALVCHAQRRPGAAHVFDVRVDGGSGTIAVFSGITFSPRGRKEDAVPLYGVEWTDAPPAARTATTPPRWLIVERPDGEVAAAVRTLLRERGAGCTIVPPAADLDTLVAREQPDVLVLVAEAHGGSVTGAWHADLPVCESLAKITRSVVRAGARTRIWVTSRGAQPAVHGLASTLALEHPGGFGALIEVGRDEAAAHVARAVVDAASRPDADDLVAFAGGRRLVPRLKRLPAPDAEAKVQGDGTYLISGGLGSLGLAVATALGERGARHVVLVSRSGATTSGRRAAADALRALGLLVSTPAVDVSDARAVRDLVAAIEAAMPPLRGVVHCAGDASYVRIEDLEAGDFDREFGGKVGGAFALFEATADSKLDFFVAVSSMIGTWGGEGQGAYAAANAVLDAFARAPQPQRPFTSIALGPVRGGVLPDAVAADMERSGVTVWTPQRAARAILHLAAHPARHVIAADIDWTVYKPLLETHRPRPLFDHFGAGPAVVAAAGATLQRLRGAGPAERDRILGDVVVRCAAAALGMRPEAWPDRSRGFFEIGMDSLTALDLRKRLERTLERPLPATLVFDHPSVEAVQHALAALLDFGPRAADPAAADTHASADETASAINARLAQLERLVERS